MPYNNQIQEEVLVLNQLRLTDQARVAKTLVGIYLKVEQQQTIKRLCNTTSINEISHLQGYLKALVNIEENLDGIIRDGEELSNMINTGEIVIDYEG